MSTPSTQSCWKVACEAAWWARPRRATYVAFMAVSGSVSRKGQMGMDELQRDG